jgi:predicted alpha/beta-hydrolase family hydrolase
VKGRFVHFPAVAPTATLVLGHGAGGSQGTAPDLQALADALPGYGISVILHEQPWKVAGKKIAPAPPTLDVAWLADLAELPVDPSTPLIVGGRSAGARVACRTAEQTGAVAVVALAFPLHPPGRPEKSRADELQVGLALRVVQGLTDPFGRPEEFPEDIDVVPVPGDHSLRKAIPEVVDAVREFVGMVTS